MTAERYVWRKLSSARWEHVWPERLQEFADRLAITALAGKPTIRVEVFALTRADGERLAKTFGGTCAKQTRETQMNSANPRKPISIRGKLSIISSEVERSAAGRNAAVLLVPAGMAFGTGEHATTLNCLRFIVDFATARTGTKWTALDLGCGTGILALAARRLGATEVTGGDFDPACVRITRENCQANELRGVKIQKFDVLKWVPERKYDLVSANLYSTILVSIAPKLARAVAARGMLVFSGVMRDQESEVTAALKKAGLRLAELKRQGKWIAGTATLAK